MRTSIFRDAIRIAAVLLVPCGVGTSWGAQPEQEQPGQADHGSIAANAPASAESRAGDVRLPSELDIDPLPAARPNRSAAGGTFSGTFAYDPQVGYDYGQHDDNGHPAEYYENNRGSEPRMPGKRTDPGDRDFFDPYYQGVLYNDGTLGDYDDLGGYLDFHGRIGRERYWRSRGFIPLRYHDFREYQRFRYELGGSP